MALKIRQIRAQTRTKIKNRWVTGIAMQKLEKWKLQNRWLVQADGIE